ncbi:hypothetical protein [Haloterrigena alkaliphila]|uniref:DUF5658 domain-containing protein n=1 Tax=Haloterrigena alkaliphila TaxID=2816475 RepID=A0A8A2VGF0_9EURY|nr:hypothetical protein [Haloterrigena alkaliphila]QSX00407.1 hypothetical protein J0X25_05415 [Haloterrigena alkaliphila]
MSGDHSTGRTPRLEDPLLEEYWDWVAVALFLWLAVDLLTSLSAAATVGLEAELNPLMAWLLARHLAVVVAAHLAIAVAVAGLFAVLFARAQAVPRRFQWAVQVGIEGFLGTLVAVGLFAFANNMTVIVFGQGLF